MVVVMVVMVVEVVEVVVLVAVGLVQSDPYSDSRGTHLMLAPDFFSSFCHHKKYNGCSGS